MKKYSRRQALSFAGKALAVGAFFPSVVLAKTENSATSFGSVVGDPLAAKAGEKFLASGANAIDAAIATAFAAGIVSPSKCGVGGYGGHAIIALAGKKITAIDFNAEAPAAARPDMFPLDGKGRVKGNLNMHGWLAASVPGTLAGLQMALERYGTLSLREVLKPAIELCEQGTYLTEIKGLDDASRNDPRPDSAQTNKNSSSARQRNFALAKLLKTLAERNSGESFYRGDIARKIAEAFKKNGGLVTVEDLAAYRAREVEPLKLEWNGMTIYTPPLTAAGLMVLEALSILKVLDWEKFSPADRTLAKLEALRIGWADRFQYFGDPRKVSVPNETLLSSEHVGQRAEKIRLALKQRTPVPLDIDTSEDDGTINISAADSQGNMIAITLTHGSTYGARVSVDEFGMILGHGMWRFDPRPGKPNSPGSGKRPVNNMCPAIVTSSGVPVMAVGGAGGLRIPNGVYEVLLNYVGLGKSMEKAMAVPRLDTSGTLKLGLEKGYSVEEETLFKDVGYNVSKTLSAYVSAVSFDSGTKKTRGLSTGGI